MDLGLKNKRVLITGGSKGIGKSIADAFYKEGSKLTVISRDEKILKKNILKYGGEKKGHYYFNCDLNILNNPTIISNKIINKLGPHEIIIHNIGGGLGVGNIFANLEDWKKVWNFNVGISIEMNNILVKNGSVVGLEVNGEKQYFDVVLISSGPWCTTLLEKNDIHLPLFPLKGQILRLENPGLDFQVAFSWGKDYLTQKEDGLLWVGTTEEKVGFDDKITSEGKEVILNTVEKFFPDIRKLKI